MPKQQYKFKVKDSKKREAYQWLQLIEGIRSVYCQRESREWYCFFTLKKLKSLQRIREAIKSEFKADLEEV